MNPPEWQVRCPVHTCRAKPGIPCRARIGSHHSRLDAWLTQQDITRTPATHQTARGTR